MLQYSTVQYSATGTVQYSTCTGTVQYSTCYGTVQYSTVQYSTVQYSTVSVQVLVPVVVQTCESIVSNTST